MTESSPPDLRWKQRFSNYQKAERQLADAVQLSRQRPLTQLEQQGLIKAFEFTQELAWNVMKDYFEYQGHTAITGSRDALREAFNKGLITDGEGWMETINSRNRSTRTYDESTARELAQIIETRYMNLFEAFATRMLELSADETTRRKNVTPERIYPGPESRKLNNLDTGLCRCDGLFEAPISNKHLDDFRAW